MSQLRTYDPLSIIATIGSHNISGFADGTFVSIEPMSDGSVSEAGADGETARALSTDTRVRVTFTLQQTSRSNDVLSEICTKDQVTRGGETPALSIVDKRGGTSVKAGHCWVVVKPKSDFSKSIETREWVIETAGADYQVGGND